MGHDALLALAAVGAVGVAAQWIAWRVGLPSILLLLLAGGVAGGAEWLNPDELLGDLLFPVVSLSVGLILFEGSLGLGRRELSAAGRPALLLCTVGAAITFTVIWFVATLVLDVGRGIGALIAANLVVTGPTVIGPLLKQVRPRGRVGAILRAEGIIIDPIGAAAAIVVFEVLSTEEENRALGDTLGTLAQIGGIGAAVGLVFAAILVLSLGRFLLPDHLRQPAIVASVLMTFAVADHLQQEAGLVAVTVLGLSLANQRRVDIESVLEFTENLQVLVLSALFIILAARLDLSVVRSNLVGNLVLLAVAVLVARPASVAVSTVRSGLARRERAFLAAIAPRGIVAASIASVFALRLDEAGIEGADQFAGAVVTVLIGTIVVYGIGGRWIGRRLDVAEQERTGVLIVGAHKWGTRLAEVLQEHGLRTLLVDRDRAKVVTARLAGRDIVHGSILSPRVRDGLELEGIGHLLAVTSNHAVNEVAVERLRSTFGRSNTWQLQTSAGEHIEGRPLGWPSHDAIERRLAEGARIRSTRLSEQFSWEQYQERNPGATLLALVREGGLVLAADGQRLSPRPGDVVVALAPPAEASFSD